MTQTTELYACLFAKEFPAQALLRLRPDLHSKPCVVLEGEAPTQHVCSLNTKARLLGMERGMIRVEVDSHSWTEARTNNFAETIMFSQNFDGDPMITSFFSKLCPGDVDSIRWS
jgi:protein ImuB